MLLSPFMPIGNAFIINTNGTGSTAQQTPVTLAALGLPANFGSPTNIRVLNKGTSDIWFNFSLTTAGTIAIPTAGTTTTGTPQPGYWAEPGVDLIFRMNPAMALIGSPGSMGIYLNTISAGTSQPLYCQFGEGT
jgi:hypothetical protein